MSEFTTDKASKQYQSEGILEFGVIYQNCFKNEHRHYLTHTSLESFLLSFPTCKFTHIPNFSAPHNLNTCRHFELILLWYACLLMVLCECSIINWILFEWLYCRINNFNHTSRE